MAAAVQRCREIDPSECRAIAELCYSPERMVGDYVDAFHASSSAPEELAVRQRTTA